MHLLSPVDHLPLFHLSFQVLSVLGVAAGVGGGPHGAVAGVHGVFGMPWWRAGAQTLVLVPRWAAVAGWAFAGDPASAATLAPAAVLAVVAAIALVAGVALGPRVAMGLGVGDGRVLCLGVHGRPLVGGQRLPPPPPLPAHAALQSP